MSDAAPAAKEEKKDTAAPASGAVKKRSEIVGPAIAAVVLLVAGIGIGTYGATVLKGVQAGGEASATAGEKGEKGEHAAEHGDNNKFEHSVEVALPDLVSNVKNQQGRHYIKVSCSLWMAPADVEKTKIEGSGGHEGAGGVDIKKIIQMSLEEQLKTYDIDELTGPNIYVQLKRGFQDQIEKALREMHPDTPPDHKYVERIVLTSLLVQ